MLRKRFVFKTDEGIGCQKKLYNEELRNLYSPPNNMMLNRESKNV
jgi:hypothetical protein